MVDAAMVAKKLEDMRREYKEKSDLVVEVAAAAAKRVDLRADVVFNVLRAIGSAWDDVGLSKATPSELAAREAVEKIGRAAYMMGSHGSDELAGKLFVEASEKMMAYVGLRFFAEAMSAITSLEASIALHEDIAKRAGPLREGGAS